MNSNLDAKPVILIVDQSSPETMQLIKILADYQIRSELVMDSEQAFSFCLQQSPALILSELKTDNVDGFHLFKRLREHPATKNLPFVFLSRTPELEERLNLLQLEIDDYITKPYYPEEVAVRVDSILQEIERHSGGSQRSHGFSGSLEDMNLMDLIQTLELGGKSAVIHLLRDHEEGFVYIQQGEVVDASLRDLGAEEALENLMMWLHGHFELNIEPVQKERQVHKSTREMLVAASQRIHTYKERANQLPPMDNLLTRAIAEAPGTLTDLERQVWVLLSKPQPLRLLISASRNDELRVMEAVQDLLVRGVISSRQGATATPDILTQNIMMRLSQSRDTNKDPYSRIASFFKRSNGEKKKPSLIKDDNIYENSTLGPIAVTHKIFLQRADLLLIRQRILSH